MPYPFEAITEKKELLPAGEVVTFRLRSFKPFVKKIPSRILRNGELREAEVQLVRGIPLATIVAERIESPPSPATLAGSIYQSGKGVAPFETREGVFWVHFALSVWNPIDRLDASRGREIALKRLKSRKTTVEREISREELEFLKFENDGDPIPSVFRTQVGLSLPFTGPEQNSQELFRTILCAICDPKLKFPGRVKKWAKNWLKEDLDNPLCSECHVRGQHKMDCSRNR